MSQTKIDALLKSPEFKVRIKEADAYAKDAGLDKWAARIVWIGLTQGIFVAKRFACRRSHFKTTPAWKAYNRLVKAGVFSEKPEGIYYDKSPEWETPEGTMRWMGTVTRIAEGMATPFGFPRKKAWPPRNKRPVDTSAVNAGNRP